MMKNKIELPITLKIENRNFHEANAVLMGYHKNYLVPNLGSDSGVKVTVENEDINHLQLMEHLECVANKMTIECINDAQIRKLLTVSTEDVNNMQAHIPIIVQSYIKPSQEEGNHPIGKVEVPYRLPIHKRMWITIPVKPMTELKVTFE